MNSKLDLLYAGNTGLQFLGHLLTAALFVLLAFTLFSLIKNYLLELARQGMKTSLAMSGLVFLSSLVFFTSQMDLSLFFLAVILAAVLGLSALHPALALANSVAFLILRPWELMPEQSSLAVLPRVFFVIFVASLMLESLRKAAIFFNKNSLQWGFLALAAWVFLSTFVSGDTVGAQASFFDGYLKSIIVAVMIFQALRSKEDYALLSGTLLIAVLGISFFALVNTYFIVDGARLEGRGAIQNANDLAALLIFILPFSFRFWLKKKWNLFSGALSLISVGLLGLGVWKAQSRAAYLALFLMLVAGLIYRFRARKVLLVQMAVAALLGLAVVSQLSLGRSESDLSESSMNRMGYWKAGVAMAVRNPLLGVGFGQFPKNYQLYGAAEFTEHGERTAHSSWILILAEAGFIGLGLFLFLFYQAAKKSWRLMNEAPELFLALIGYGVTMSFLSHTYMIYPYILFAMILSYPVKEPLR